MSAAASVAIEWVEHRHEARREITLLELVAAVASVAETDEELIATISDLVNTGKIKLIGNFRGVDVVVD